MKDDLFKGADATKVLDEAVFRIIASKYCRIFNTDFDEVIKAYKLSDAYGKQELQDNLLFLVSLCKEW